MSTLLKLYVPAQKASPGPPLGAALGQKGIKAMDFCKQFNDQTKDMEPGTELPVFVTCKTDKTFTFKIKPPTNTWFLKRATQIDKLSTERKVGYISVKQLYEISKLKHADFNLEGFTLEGVFRMLASSAKMGGLIITK